ncbi:hypothetical protein HHE014_08540 [Helicobacter heilmannii]|nr:hypothetical protein HHE014_08540 [Helicobacter heilmannii]
MLGYLSKFVFYASVGAWTCCSATVFEREIFAIRNITGKTHNDSTPNQ